MTCVEVRDRLTEHALGVLPKADSREVDRHLDSCPGCRRESADLHEGAAAVALSLPPAEVPTSLEGLIVRRLRTAMGREPAPVRRRLRVMAGATLAAALIALTASGWAMAERKHAQTLLQTVVTKSDEVKQLTKAINSFGGLGKTFQATLLPRPGGRGNGSAVIFSAPQVDDFVFVDVVLSADAKGPFIVQLVDGENAINAGNLIQTVEGDWVLPVDEGFLHKDLSKVVSVTVLDNAGRVVVTGTVHPYAGS